MAPEEPLNDPETRNGSDDPLDRLLATAQFPQSSPAAQERLREAWMELRSQQRARRAKVGAWSSAAAAAVVLIAAGTWWTLSNQPDPNARRTYLLSNNPTDRGSLVIAPAPTAPTSRRATVGEQLILQSAIAHTKGAPLQAPVRSTSKQMFEQIREALAVVSSDPSSAAPVAESLARNVGAARAARRLTELAQSRFTPHRLAAVRLLSELGDAAALPVLLQLSHDPSLRTAAMSGVMRLSDSTALASLYQAERDPTIKQQMLQTMLSRGQGTTEYLALVRNPATRDAALAMLHTMPGAPVDALVNAFDSPRVDERFAAARALAEVCDQGGAGETLRRMIEQDEHRREALAALMLCRDPAAAAFLANVRVNRSIDAEIRSLQLQLSNFLRGDAT